jgi:hypothetical protein
MWLGLTIVVIICTILSVLFVKGVRFVLSIVAMRCLATVGILLWQFRKQHPKPNLELSMFAYKTPNWMSDKLEVGEWKEETIEKLMSEVVKAAFVLLAFERTETGLWAKSYLYRKREESAVGGSLTGTPAVLVALHSIIGTGTMVFDTWKRDLGTTLLNNIDEKGRYLKAVAKGTTSKTRDPEPERHQAGGCLLSMFANVFEGKNAMAISRLCDPELGKDSWDIAIVARTLLEYSCRTAHPSKTTRKARAVSTDLVHDLIEKARGTSPLTRIWAAEDPDVLYVINLWSTVWGLLPFIQSGILSDKERASLAEKIHLVLRSHADEARGKYNLLPGAIDTRGKGIGKSVFGTAMSVLAWRTLEINGLQGSNGGSAASPNSQLALGRLLRDPKNTIELPSVLPPEDSPLEIEGYLGWAAILMAGASVGIRLKADEASRGIGLAERISEAFEESRVRRERERELRNVFRKDQLLDEDLMDVVIRSAMNINELVSERRSGSAKAKAGN